MVTGRRGFIIGAGAALVVSGCEIVGTPSPSSGPATRRSPGSAQQAPTQSTTSVDPRQVERLRGVMVPLLQHMDHPIPLNQVRVGLIGDSHINAANGGGGDFYVTTGLLERASDDDLRAIMAHETAHADLGHVAKLQRLGAGLNLGVILLEQIHPIAEQLGPLAAQLVANAYTRNEEYAADSHGVEILNRAGFDGKAEMTHALTWLIQTEGESGGFFATHPATGDRIQRVQRL
jgi:predicted Zn-dependent protease